MKLIDKAALIAAIKERLNHNGIKAELDRSAFMAGREKEDEDILILIDSLEVKEVNLEKEIDVWYQKPPKEFENIEECAKHFFELGLKAKG